MDKIKDALTLTLITLIAGVLLGGVYELTKEPIAQRKIEANAKAYQMVLPEAVEFRADESLSGKVAVSDSLLRQSELAMEQVTVDNAVYGYDGTGAFAGLIVEVTSKDGYGGAIQLAVGIREEGTAKVVSGIDFLEINEQTGAEREYLLRMEEKVEKPFSYEPRSCVSWAHALETPGPWIPL